MGGRPKAAHPPFGRRPKAASLYGWIWQVDSNLSEQVDFNLVRKGKGHEPSGFQLTNLTVGYQINIELYSIECC